MNNKYITKIAMGLLLFIGGLSLSAQVVVPAYSGDQCESSTISFAANFPGATSYLWEFGNAGANTSTKENPLFSYPDTGLFQIKLTVVKNGTTTVGTTSIRIYPKPELVTTLDPQDTQCFSTNRYCYTVNSPNMPGNICTMKVLWGDGTFVEVKNPTMPYNICKKYTTNSTVDYAYDIEVELTSCNGCVTYKKYPSAAVVKAALGLGFWSSNPKGCDSVLARFVNKSLITKANAKRFIWFFGDGTVDSTNWGAKPDWDTTYHWFKTQGPRDGTFTTKFYVESQFGCSDTFIDNASATNFVFRPRILSSIDSACSTADIDFKLVGGPPISTLRSWMWHFVDLPVVAPPCSGCEDNDKDYPEASFSYGGAGPFQLSLYMNHNLCGPIIVFDTVQVIGPGSKIEDIPNGIMIAQNHRYQCIAKDTVQFTNVSTFYHNDSIFKDDDHAYVWSLTDTFEMITGTNEYGLVNPAGDSLTIFNKIGGSYVFISKEFRDSNQRYHDGELVHEFKGDQTSYNVNRTKDHVFRIWDFDDPHAPKCTTDTKAGKNVGINCQYSMDSLPQHWYTDWDTALAYWRLQPMTIGIFNDGTKSCSRKNVWYSDSVAVIRYVSPFFGKDSIKIGRDSFGRGNTYTYIGGDTLVTDTIPLPFYRPGYHTLIKKEKGNGVTAADSIDPILYRKLYFNTTARCYNVKLTHLDTVHPFRCEKTDNISLAIRPPSAKGVQWKGIRCLAPPSPPYGIVFNVSQTKPGCSQDILQFNFDSASGKNNWVPMVGGLFPGSAPPPPPMPVMPYAIQGTFPTSFVYLYTAGNVTDKKNGWVTVGTIVGNGATTTKPCYDTVFYNRMLKFRFANPAYTIERPIPRAQDDKAVCRYDSVYINMTELLQPEVETFDFNWGDGDRVVENKKSFDTAQVMKKFFSNNITNIERYINDTGNLSGRMSRYAAYLDSVKHGWTPARTFSALDDFHFHQKLAYPRDSIKKWLDDPKTLIGWLIVERNLDKDKVYEAKKGLFPSVDVTLYDTFLTSIVTDYKVNVIIAPEITPLIIDIFNQLGFDYFDIPSNKIGEFFGPPGSGRCIDTTGYSNFISFEYEEASEAGIKRLSARDSAITKNWVHQYEVAQIYNPRVLTRTRIDGCVQFKSVPIKVGFGKEIIFSDTVLCIDRPLFGLANYWYWSTIRIDGGITDDYDYWRDFSRLSIPKEAITKWDWNLNDAVFYNPGGGEYGGAGLGSMPYSRFRLGGGASGQTTVLKSLTAGLDIGNSGSTIYYKSPGVFPLGILAVDSNGCRDTTIQDIYVTKVTSKFFFDLDTPACKSILLLEDSSFVDDGCAQAGYGKCDSIVEWRVSWGDGSRDGGKNNFNRFDQLGHNYTRKGRFTVTLWVTSAKGCVDSFSRELFIPGPVPRFEPASLRICQDDRLAFANLSDSPTTSARWIFDFGDSETQDRDKVADSFFHIYTVPGVYDVYLWQFDSIPNTGKYCPAVYPDTFGGQQQKITITVVAYDSTHINVTDDVICKGEEVKFFNSTRNPNDTTWQSYKWIFDTENRVSDSISSTDSFIIYAYQNSGVYLATVIPQYNPLLQKPYCPFRDTIRIFVDTVKARFGVDTALTPTMKFVNGSFNGSTYRWWFLYKDSVLARSLSDGQAAMSTELNPVYTYDSLGCYYVVLETTSPSGCKDTTIQLVCNQFKFLVKTYNVFTPGNKDGKNDVFDIDIEGQDMYELVIYNRYGTKVFESNSSLNDWNGRLFNTGAYAASGTYYYYLRYKNKRTDKEPEELFGVVELLK